MAAILLFSKYMDFNINGARIRRIPLSRVAWVGGIVATAFALFRRRSIRRQRDRLAADNRAKDELIATLSHELRTPLTSVLGWIELLRDGRTDEETRRLALQSIEQSTRTQKKLVDDLLDRSRILRGQLAIAREAIAVQDPLAESLLVLQPEAAAKRVSLRFDAPADPLIVTGDHHRLKQVAWNLLSNALKFTPEGGVIEVTVSRDSGAAVVSVRDTGSGIDPAVLPDLFQRFRQGTGGANKGGLGLGLALCRYVVEAHGGTIEVESDGSGCGTRATVRLPISPPLARAG